MLRWIIEASLRYRYLMLGFSVVIMVFGLQRMRDMSVDVLPEFEPPIVELQTEALGLSAEEVERLVTLNLEEFLAGTSWMESITSESTPSLSSVLLTFEPGTDLMRARQLVQERLTLSYTMPNVTKAPVMLQPLSATNRATMIGLTSKTVSPIHMSVLARWTIKPRLMGVPGVANVVMWGQRKRQLQVLIDPERLEASNVTQDQVIRTAGDALWVSPLPFLNASVPGTGGWIDTPQQRLGIRHELPISEPEDLAEMPLHGSTLRLGDVAEVVEGHPLMIGDAWINSEPGLILVVEKLPWARTEDVTLGVERALKALRVGLPGIEVNTTVFRSASFIETATHNIAMTMLISVAFIVFVFSLFLFNWRPIAIALVSLATSLLAAILFLNWRDEPINMIVIAGVGMAIAAMIDDAIVDLDSIIVRRRKTSTRGNKIDGSFIIDACMAVRRPAAYGLAISLLGLVPIFALGGTQGAFYQPLVWSYYIAILCSMFSALLVVPALSWLFLSDSVPATHKAPLTGWMRDAYAGMLGSMLGSTKVAAIWAVLLLVVGGVFFSMSSTDLLPTFRERSLLLEVEAIPGTSHKAMSRLMMRISDDLRKIDGITDVGAHIGRAVASDQVLGVHSSQIWVNVADRVDYDKTMAQVAQTISEFEGVHSGLKTYMHKRAFDAVGDNTNTLVVRVYGPERPTLNRKTQEAKDALGRVSGITDLRIDWMPEEPQVQVTVDIDRAQEHGVKPGDVRRAAATVFAGIEAGSLFEEQKVFDVVVWGEDSARDSITRLEELLIDTPDGDYVRLAEIAEIKMISSPSIIKHEGVSPYVDIMATVTTGDYDTLHEDIYDALEHVKWPMEYHPEILDDYAQKKGWERGFWTFALAAAIGIFLVLQSAFNSWRLAGAVFFALPLALAGGFVSAFFSGATLSLGSMLGFFAIYTVTARHGLTMLSHMHDLQEQGEETFGAQLVQRGASERFMPTMIMLATLALALIPWIWFGNIAGLEFEHPMAVVMFGGLFSSMVFTLLILPSLYLNFGQSSASKAE